MSYVIPGMMGVVWCGVWGFMAFSSPHEHPRISEAELNYLQHALSVKQEVKVSVDRTLCNSVVTKHLL